MESRKLREHLSAEAGGHAGKQELRETRKKGACFYSMSSGLWGLVGETAVGGQEYGPQGID